MRKWLFVILVLLVNIQLSLAQNNLIEVKSSGTNLFIDHKVTAKESLYSLGRLYNVPPNELASFNKLAITTGLNIGQELKIPLNKNNFTQTDNVSANEVLVPVHHTLKEHETLYRVGQQYNKVSPDQLKKWNHIQSDMISTGTPLIVGFLKVDKNQSSLSEKGSVPEIAVPEQKSQAEEVKTKPVVAPTIVQNKNLEIPAKENKQEPAPPIPKVAEEKISVSDQVKRRGIDFAGGTFKKAYEKQNHQNQELNSSTAIGGIFKSTSGWQDGKYYCFNNVASAGTVLKITDKESGKSIYAKVLDAIPDIKQNSGLQIIISNAAADELGVGEKFECEISL